MNPYLVSAVYDEVTQAEATASGNPMSSKVVVQAQTILANHAGIAKAIVARMVPKDYDAKMDRIRIYVTSQTQV